LKRTIGLRRQLNTFDVTNLVVGSIIGADIYVAAALGARLVGPASLVVWFIAGIIAVVVALSFSYCATILPRVGGPYSYTKQVAGSFNGFMVGWALLLAEWFSLAVFPVAFTQYFLSLIPTLEQQSQVYLKGLFIAIILATNITGVKAAGKFNDILTIGKLIPLILLTGLGVIFIGLAPEIAAANFHPFVSGDLRNFGQALVLIFWAYAGFELSTLPADEIQRPMKTIPRAIVVGMFIVIVFYMVTNFVIIGVVDQKTLGSTSTPLMAAATKVFSWSAAVSEVGAPIVGIGALISIMGADESGTIGTSRLAYAMSIDGLLPRIFSRLHKSFQTPYIGLVIICSTAFIASVVGTLASLINASVFLLSFVYLSTCVSVILLEREYPASKNLRGRRIIPVLGIAFSLMLMTQVDVQQILVSFLLLAVGVPIYIFFSPKKELDELKQAFLSREAVLKRAYDQTERFLAYPVSQIRLLIYRAEKIEKAWDIKESSQE
jgi:APA family basic amino acid/polyamine antiporter